MFTILAPWGRGSGSALPFPILLLATFCTLFSVFFSAMSIFLHLKNYRKPLLQRMVIRIMVMVPVYAVASLISLFSLDAAFVIDAIRDIYEAFVIYCFFNLLLGYLGGERSLLIRLHGREPKPAIFPMSLFKREIDVSDPYFFLFLKRGIIQYVQIKPILAVATLILKAVGKFNEGDLRANSGYLYVSIVYNISICLSLYCLAMFWMCVAEDLTPYRPMPKFLCVKGILFLTFWESFFISILVAAGAIRKLGPYTDNEHISLGLTDTMLCLEMPIFAIAHMYAFSHKDYIDPKITYCGRMPIFYALRDAFGLKDVVEDSKATLRGEGINYREFEPAEGLVHQGIGRERRIKAGLRYSKGGQNKYWLPMPADLNTSTQGILDRVRNDDDEEVYAPLLEEQAAEVVHEGRRHIYMADRQGLELPFGDLDEEDEQLFEQSKSYLFGDYMYPCIDASSESARRAMWEEEERILRDERGAYFSPIRRSHGIRADLENQPAYGATRNGPQTRRSGSGKSSPKGKEPEVNTAQPVSSWRDEGYLVDKSELHVPAPSDAVRLGWTNKHSMKRTTSQSPQSASQGRTFVAPDRKSETPSPSLSRTPSSQMAQPRPRKISQVRPDAVDIVPQSSEHPAESARKSTDNLLAVPVGQNKNKPLEERVAVPLKVEPQDPTEERTVDETEEVVAIEVSPPVHSQLDPSFGNLEHNPWG